MADAQRQGFPSKPAWVIETERRIGRAIPLSPNAISTLKLFVMTPLFIFAMRRAGDAHGGYLPPILLYLCVGALDYLDGVVARAQNKATRFGRVYDRLTDLPLGLFIAWNAIRALPDGLVFAKIALDVVIMGIYLAKKGAIKNRMRTAIGSATALVLILVTLDFPSRFINADLACALLWVNIFVNLIVILRRLRILQARFIADTLSTGNLLCGFLSMYMAHLSRIDISIVFLLIGAGFDGLDGMAARKFGSTRWGMYSDDIADGVNYGIAPGVAIFFHFGSDRTEGIVIGGLFALFTIGRLVFFTLNKSGSDPNYFSGVPSTIGGIVALTSAYLFKDYPAILGLMVGAACVLMVSFDTRYRHLGRALAQHQRMLAYIPLVLVLFLVFGALWGRTTPIVLILALSLGYGLLPVVRHFKSVLQARQGV